MSKKSCRRRCLPTDLPIRLKFSQILQIRIGKSRILHISSDRYFPEKQTWKCDREHIYTP